MICSHLAKWRFICALHIKSRLASPQQGIPRNTAAEADLMWDIKSNGLIFKAACVCARTGLNALSISLDSALVTHAGCSQAVSRVVMAPVCVCVCVFICLHCKRKMARAVNTKVGIISWQKIHIGYRSNSYRDIVWPGDRAGRQMGAREVGGGEREWAIWLLTVVLG